MSLPKLIIPPEFCYYAFHYKEPQQIPNLWRQLQLDRKAEDIKYDELYNPVKDLLDLLRAIEHRSLAKDRILDKIHEVFSGALMHGYEKMEDLVDNVGLDNRVEEIRNILIPFLPPQMKPFIADHHRKSTPPSQRLHGEGRPHLPKRRP